MTIAPPQGSVTDPIRVWRGRLWQERRAREERRTRMLESLWQALAGLEATYHWAEVFAFGSITRPGAFSRSSDVDVAVSGMDPRVLYRAVGELSDRLGVDVDVVRLEECRFADKIRSEGVPWKK